MAKKAKQPDRPRSVHIKNRRAWRDFHIKMKVECGMELLGTEVKSLRAGQVKIDEAHARVKNGEVFLLGANFALYPQAAAGMQHNPTRARKLLLHRRQIREIEAHTRQKGHTVVPLEVFFKRGWAKCILGLAVGKQKYDKRESLKKREQQREMSRHTRSRRLK
ncbi:MAG: SsrA-binding protein SmpB [Planctomycetota bacterium]|jgi:SsrA-binding protein